MAPRVIPMSFREDRGGCYSREELLTLTPFGPEALYLNRAMVMPEGNDYDAVGYVEVSTDHCRGHFPGQPILPGHLMIEATNNLLAATIAARLEESGFDRSAHTITGLFRSLTSFKAFRPCTPGHRLKIFLKVDSRRSIKTSEMVTASAVGWSMNQLSFEIVGLVCLLRIEQSTPTPAA